jgi:adenosylcobinamide-phosphate synthase
MFVSGRELLAGVALDLAFGDPPWLPHPVRGIGWMAVQAEKLWRATGLPLAVAGVGFWLSVVSLTAALVGATVFLGGMWARIYWIYTLLAARDLDVQAGRVVKALRHNNLTLAREKLSCIVGRDTAALSEAEILRATLETVAENLSDGVVAPLFYLALAGPVGMAAYKAVNTLDSMVGYRNQRYKEFGWASARLDDVANFVPARLTAVLIWLVAMLPGFHAWQSMRVTFRDGASQPSPNAGFPEAAVAGALRVQLGGLNFYQGVPSAKPTLGDAVLPLSCEAFKKVRLLLYASEAVCVAAIAGCLPWL